MSWEAISLGIGQASTIGKAGPAITSVGTTTGYWFLVPVLPESVICNAQ